jgi:DNA-binding SARP family transcriptional activator
MEEKTLEEIRNELRAIRSMIQPGPRMLTKEESEYALKVLARIRRDAKKIRVKDDSTLLIREDRER